MRGHIKLTICRQKSQKFLNVSSLNSQLYMPLVLLCWGVSAISLACWTTANEPNNLLHDTLAFDSWLIYALKLQKLQNRAAGITTNSSFDASSKPLIQNLGWKTVTDMIIRESTMMVYTSINNIAPQYMSEIFTRNSQDEARQLRNTDTDLKMPKKKTCNGQKSFSFVRCAKLWCLTFIIV